jgi:hypothetical protein
LPCIIFVLLSALVFKSVYKLFEFE